MVQSIRPLRAPPSVPPLFCTRNPSDFVERISLRHPPPIRLNPSCCSFFQGSRVESNIFFAQREKTLDLVIAVGNPLWENLIHTNAIMKKIQPTKQGFTLIELLTVIAIIGILASILIPTVGRVRESARRTVDASNIRQIGQASLIFANDNREQLPTMFMQLSPTGLQLTGGTSNIKLFAAALALQGGLNDAQIWFSGSDRLATPVGLSTILNSTRTGLQTPQFNGTDHTSFQAFGGLTLGLPSTTPIAFTRGLTLQGVWSNQGSNSVYGGDGGHIVFLGGNVNFFRDIQGNNRLVGGPAGGTDGRTQVITEAVRAAGTANTRALLPGSGTGSITGNANGG